MNPDNLKKCSDMNIYLQAESTLLQAAERHASIMKQINNCDKSNNSNTANTCGALKIEANTLRTQYDHASHALKYLVLNSLNTPELNNKYYNETLPKISTIYKGVYSPLTGGSIYYYNKYMKYKTKYIQLSKTI